MTFKIMAEIWLLTIMCTLIVFFGASVMLSSLGHYLIHKWFYEREAYVKRMSGLPDIEHEQEYDTKVN